MSNNTEWVVLVRFPDCRNGWEYSFGFISLNLHKLGLVEIINNLFADPNSISVWGQDVNHRVRQDVIDIYLTKEPCQVLARFK